MPRDIRAHAATNTFESVRTLAHLLCPDNFHWETELSPRMRHVPYVLHIGCNVHYTLFIPFIAQKIMEKLQLQFIVAGGPENCCGAAHMHLNPDLENMVGSKSVSAFKRVDPQVVLDVCPRCTAGFTKHAAPGDPVGYMNFAELLIQHLDTLKKMMAPVKKRVVLHYHDSDEVLQRDWHNISTILAAIPGIEILPAQHARGPARHCTINALYRDYKKAAGVWETRPAASRPMAMRDVDHMFEEAKNLGADVWVAPYHSCYWRYVQKQLKYGIEVQNYLGLLATSLGIPFEEPLKDLRLLDDIDAAMNALRPKVEALGYREEAVRSFVQRVIYFDC